MTLTFDDLRPRFLGLDPSPLPRIAQGGGVYADLFVEDSALAAVRIEGGEVVRVARDRQRGFALRSISQDGRTRIASSTSLDPVGALALAKEIAFPGSASASGSGAFGIFEVPARVRPESVSLDRRIELA